MNRLQFNAIIWPSKMSQCTAYEFTDTCPECKATGFTKNEISKLFRNESITSQCDISLQYRDAMSNCKEIQ